MYVFIKFSTIYIYYNIIDFSIFFNLHSHDYSLTKNLYF